MSRIAGMVRGLSRKDTRVLRQILDENSSRQSRAQLSGRAQLPNSGLRSVDLGKLRIPASITSFKHSLGTVPTKVEITPLDGDGQVHVARESNNSVIYLKADAVTTVRVRVYL